MLKFRGYELIEEVQLPNRIFVYKSGSTGDAKPEYVADDFTDLNQWIDANPADTKPANGSGFVGGQKLYVIEDIPDSAVFGAGSPDFRFALVGSECQFRRYTPNGDLIVWFPGNPAYCIDAKYFSATPPQKEVPERPCVDCGKPTTSQWHEAPICPDCKAKQQPLPAPEPTEAEVTQMVAAVTPVLLLYPSFSEPGVWQLEAYGKAAKKVKALQDAGFRDVTGQNDYIDDRPYALVRFRLPEAQNEPHEASITDHADEHLKASMGELLATDENLAKVTGRLTRLEELLDEIDDIAAEAQGDWVAVAETYTPTNLCAYKHIRALIDAAKRG